MLCCLFHNKLSDRDTSRKENIIKPLFQQLLVFLPAALDNRNIAFREAFFYNRCNDSRSCRCIGGNVGGIRGGLDDRGISRGERVRQRLHRQHKRIIPRGHHERDAVWLLHQISFCRKIRHADRDTFCFAIGFDIPVQPADFRKRQPDLAHIAFRFRFSKIFCQRLTDFFFVRQDRSLEPF